MQLDLSVVLCKLESISHTMQHYGQFNSVSNVLRCSCENEERREIKIINYFHPAADRDVKEIIKASGFGFHPRTHVRTFKSTRMTINQCFVRVSIRFIQFLKIYLHFGFIMWRHFKLTSRRSRNAYSGSSISDMREKKRLRDLSSGHWETGTMKLKKILWIDDGKPTLLLHCSYTHSARASSTWLMIWLLWPYRLWKSTWYFMNETNKSVITTL